MSQTTIERSILLSINSEKVQMVEGVCLNINGARLRDIYHSSKAVMKVIDSAILKGFGGSRPDQEVQNVDPEYLLVIMHCFTDERFIDVLSDYDSGRMINRMQEEFSHIGLDVIGLEIKIENLEEVNMQKTRIIKRYLTSIHKKINGDKIIVFSC